MGALRMFLVDGSKDLHGIVVMFAIVLFFLNLHMNVEIMQIR